MKSTEDIIARYGAASENDRLYLFLQYPDFRERFTQLEMNRAQSNTVGRTLEGVTWYRQIAACFRGCCSAHLR